MKYCPSCGMEADDSQDFCYGCGSYFNVNRKSRADVPVPSDPLGAGCLFMDEGRFSEAIGAWRGGLDEGMDVDDITYDKILDSTIGCVISAVLTPQEYTSAGVPDFARMMPDREFIPDLMSKISDNLEICMIQNGVLGLATPYMMLLSDCFVVYPDIRDLQAQCAQAADVLDAMVAKAESLPAAPQARGPPPMKWLVGYRDLEALLRSAIDNAVSLSSRERLDELADIWSSEPELSYLRFVRAAFNISAQAVVAGRFSSKMFLRARDHNVRAFASAYLRK